MGEDLPPPRVKPSRPFVHSGQEYIMLDQNNNKGQSIHSVQVNEGCFIGALTRYMARRGKSSNIYSQNAGSSNEVQKLRKLFLSDDHINWIFVC